MTLETQVMAWDRHKNVAELNRLMGFQPSPLDNWISNGNTYINMYWMDLKQQYVYKQKIKDLHGSLQQQYTGNSTHFQVGGDNPKVGGQDFF